MSGVGEAWLSPEQRRAFERGVREFNQGYFFECHDTLEELWSELRGPGRDFFQGLIQVSVAFYHLGNGNRGGALSMLQRAQRRFASYPGRCFGFDLDAHRGELRQWEQRVETAELAGLSRDQLPSWHFEPAAAQG